MTETQRENTSVWNEFKKLTHLSLYYSDSSASNSAGIYANNNNQVKIGIRVRAENQQGQPLNLTPGDLIGKISLCDSVTGEKIDERKWTLSEDDKGYAKAINYSGQSRAKRESDNGSIYIQRYLSSSSLNENGYRFSVAIDVPSIGKFNTSDNGTNTPNAPKGREGTPFKSPKSLLISTQEPIDYSLAENVKVKHMPKHIDDFIKVVSDMKVTKPGHDSIIGGNMRYFGISSKAKFTIHPQKLDHYFHLVFPQRNKITFKANFPNDVLPDMVRGTGGKNFDVQFVFVNRETYGIGPSSSIGFVGQIQCSVDKYNIGPLDHRHYFYQSLADDCITVNICNHRIPWSNMSKPVTECVGGWNDEGRTINVDVTDNYGNSSVVKIQAPPNDNPWPQLYVNGQ